MSTKRQKVEIRMYIQPFLPGSIISVFKSEIIEHVGLVVGLDQVAHASPKNGRAVISTFKEFCEGQRPKLVRMLKIPGSGINKAYQLIREGYKYDLFASNCEHFVSKCEGTKSESPQLVKWFLVLSALAVLIIIFRK